MSRAQYLNLVVYNNITDQISILSALQEGKRRCYEVGTALRKRYDGFLNASYHYSLIDARSTYSDRCKESLQLVLAGLFPPTQELIWYDGMDWLPIAIHYDKKETDKVFSKANYIQNSPCWQPT